MKFSIYMENNKLEMIFLIRTRNLFQQLMTDYQEWNRESTATEEHKVEQQLMPVLRAEWQILYEETN